MNSGTSLRIRIWDLPTRVFHWALALGVAGLIVTGSVGGSAMVWHFRLGQAVMSLLLFRLAWGLVGGRWSRFSSLAWRPQALVQYLRGQGRTDWRAGHSPLGTLSLLAFLLALSVQVATGLVSNDDIAFAGPLSHLVSSGGVALATGYHEGWGKWLILALVALHLLAIAWYTLRGRKLVGAMLHGDKTLDQPVPASRDDGRMRLLAVVLLAACVGAGAWVFSLAPPVF